MRFFGDADQWSCPASDGQVFVEPPVGWMCGHGCGRPIEAGDTGVLLPYLSSSNPDETELAYHRACFMASLGLPDLPALLLLKQPKAPTPI